MFSGQHKDRQVPPPQPEETTHPELNRLGPPATLAAGEITSPLVVTYQ